jgi:lipopolysaccharide export system permease protein
MSLLQRYFWRQALWPLIISLSALTGLALLTQSLSTLDLIVENRQSAVTFLYITILALPQLVAIIMPLAVFMATLYALNRLNVDSELIVAKSVGSSPLTMSSPLIRLATYAMIVHLFLNLLLQPMAFREMRSELLTVRTDIASQMVRAGEFVTPTPGLTVYTREILPNGHMKDVLIRDARETDETITYTAKTGFLSRNSTHAKLTLNNGFLQQMEEDGVMTPTTFESYEIGLSDVVAFDSILRLKASDRYLHELLRPDPREYANRQYRKSLMAEGHARLSAPLYNIALVLLALAFLVRGEHRKLGYGPRIAMCAFIGFTIRLGGYALNSAAEGSPSLNILQYALPVAVCLFCGWYLSRKRRALGLRSLFRLRRKSSPGPGFGGHA